MSLTGHLSPAFFQGVAAMAARMRARGAGITGEDLLAVFNSESGIRNIPNGAGFPFAGLNQMGLEQRRGAGFFGSTAEWLALDPAEQLPFVERYFTNATGGNLSLLRDVGSLYLANFLPAFMPHAKESDFVLAAEGGPRIDIYNANRVIDTDRDGAITVSDLVSFVKRSQTGRQAAYWNEALGRLRTEGGESPSPSPFPSSASATKFFTPGFTLAALGALVYGGYRLSTAYATPSRRPAARKAR